VEAYTARSFTSDQEMVAFFILQIIFAILS